MSAMSSEYDMRLRLDDQRTTVRFFERDDTCRLLHLMRELAEFENYLPEFAVAEVDLLERGLIDNPEFQVLVAEDTSKPGELVGMAVFYFVPFTYDLRPDLVLKELYVAGEMRGKHVGRLLMRHVSEMASELGCKRIKWLVLHDNEVAKRFYKSLGAVHDTKWENWQLVLES